MSYTPLMPQLNTSIYSLGSRRRTAQYPTFVRTPIPGAGFNRRLVMASQPLMLNGDFAVPARRLTSRDNRRLVMTSHGLGAVNPMDVVNVAAGLLTNPDATLRTRGPALVAAVDTHLMAPLVQSVVKEVKPYVFKYVLPPLVLIMVTSALGAWFGYKIAQKTGA